MIAFEPASIGARLQAPNSRAEADTAHTLSRLLEALGHKVRVAFDGHSALEMA